MRTSLNINFESIDDYEKFTKIIEEVLLEEAGDEINPEYLVDTNYRQNANGGKSIRVVKNHNFKHND